MVKRHRLLRPRTHHRIDQHPRLRRTRACAPRRCPRRLRANGRVGARAGATGLLHRSESGRDHAVRTNGDFSLAHACNRRSAPACRCATNSCALTPSLRVVSYGNFRFVTDRRKSPQVTRNDLYLRVHCATTAITAGQGGCHDTIQNPSSVSSNLTEGTTIPTVDRLLLEPRSADSRGSAPPPQRGRREGHCAVPVDA